MSWTPRPLGEILDLSGYDRAGDRDLPVLSITMKRGLVDQADKFKKRIASADTSNYRIAYKNELVVGFPIDEGVLGFQTKYPAGIVSPAYDVWRLKNETECHIPYLECFLRSPQARRLYASRMQGAVARRRSLTKTDFLELEIPFPQLNDQIRIARLLSEVSELVTQRKQYVRQLDDLLKSVFEEMFGDPLRNEKGWEKKSLSTLLVDIESGKSPSCEARPAAANEWGVLKLGAITSCYYNEGENKAFPGRASSSDRHEIKEGDLLFSRKNTYDLVAACAYVFTTRPKLLMPDLIFRFVFRDDAEVNPVYIWKLLTANSQRRKIQSLAAGSAGSMPNISKTNLREIRLPIPPLPLQNKFAEIVRKVEGLKPHYHQSLSDLEALYGVVSQRAFRGELDLSRVPLPEISIYRENASANDPARGGANPAINLPDSDLLLAALEDRSSLKELLYHWLEAYRGQIANEPFSSDRFMAVAQARLSELHPDPDFELCDSDHEHIKNWVFESLVSGKLIQSYDEVNNLVRLKTGQA